MNPIRIGILGYGNLGRGIELAVAANDDMELVGVFTRRDPATVHPLGENVAVWPATELAAHTDDIDVLMLAGGSATDLPEQTPAAAALYNVVDSFDTHANIPAHFAAVDAVARETGHVAVISVGWDPGMFSVSRVYANAIMPNGADYTFAAPLEGAGTVLAAAYDSSGQMAGCASAARTAEQASVTLTLSLSQTPAEVRVFCLEDGTWRPLTKALP